MKKILFLAADLCSGGAERQMVTVACLLKNECYDVSFYCYDTANFYEHLLIEAEIPIIWEVEENPLRRIKNVRKYVRKGCYDAVISFLPVCNFLNDLAAMGKHNWKVITGERSSRESTFTSSRGKLFGRLQVLSDFIVCNSQNACVKWLQHYPQYTDKLKVVYNCVQIGAVYSDYISKKDGKLHIIVAATYQHLKNPLGLVNALLLMSDEERSQVVIDWYGRMEMGRGNTSAYDDTVNAVINHNLGEVLRLHSDTPEIANKMHQADVVMLLSRFEGLPNAVCEGMVLGKPVIMTRVSDYSMLVGKDNGIVCDFDKPESIKDAILKMSSLTSDQLVAMGQSSRQKARTLFAEDIILQKWKDILA